MSARVKAWLPIAALIVILVCTLIIGRGRPDHSAEARARSIASGIKCLVCQGLSVEQSKASSARLIYSEIQRQVANGRTDDDIRGYLVGRFGQEMLLLPTATGESSIVWIVPVALSLVALAGLAFAFARWRSEARLSQAAGDLSALDAALVARARRARRGGDTASDEAAELDTKDLDGL